MNPKKISEIAQIASVLEVSGYPKPGNVHRTRDFEDMVFEDFLISGIAIGDSVKSICILSKEKKNDLSKLNLGFHILEGVKNTFNWVENNTNLGIIMLLMPISAAASISSYFNEIQGNVGKILKQTTVNDAINLYEAINLADAGGMGEQSEFDLKSSDAVNELIEKNQTMFDVLKISSSWDKLGYELTHEMEFIFKTGYPTYHKLKKEHSLNYANIITFLTILSEIPDTLISRKYGSGVAEEVSKNAKNVLDSPKDELLDNIKDFDDFLFENKLNPGTTADLTAASIMLSFLKDEFDKN